MFFISLHVTEQPEAALLAHTSELLHNSDICPLLKRLLNSLMTDQMVKIAPFTPKITTPSPRCLSVASSQLSHSSPDVQGAHGEGFFH